MFYRLLFFVALLHLFLYWKLYLCLGAGRWKWAYFGAVLAVLAAPFGERAGLPARLCEILFALSITEFVIAGILCAVLIFTDILRLLLGIGDRLAGTANEALLTPCRSVSFALIVVLCFLPYGVYEAWNVKRVDIEFSTKKLPQGIDRLRIVQVSDVHLGGLYPVGHLKRIMNIVRSAAPDILVVTGDLVDGNMDARTEESKLLAENGAKYGAFAVTGNHEAYAGLDQAIAFMEHSGLTVLRGQAVEVAGIVLAGLDDPAVSGTDEWPDDMHVPEDRFVVLLKHRPGTAEGSDGKFDLQLSGHTHGGQIWPIRHSVRRRYGYDQGLTKSGNADVYTSNGAGFWGAPLRFLTPPEVTVFDLIREK